MERRSSTSAAEKKKKTDKPETEKKRKTLNDAEFEDDYDDVSVSFSDEEAHDTPTTSTTAATTTTTGGGGGGGTDATLSTIDVDRKISKKSWSTRTKQNLGNSAVGKALFNKFVDKETKKLINALMVLVEKDKDKKAAKKLKADIFKVAVKVIVLHEDKVVSTDEFIKLRGNFRRICSATRNGYRTGVIDLETATRIAELIQHFADGIKEIIGKFVSSGTIDRVDGLTQYIGTTDFLVRTSQFKEFDTVAYVLAYYLQET